MLTTVLLAFLAGFTAGNGLPYDVKGSVGEADNPAPFGGHPAVDVVVGSLMFVAAGACWYVTDVSAYPLPGWAAAALGVLGVGLVHAQTWRHNPWPWRRRAAGRGHGGEPPR